MVLSITPTSHHHAKPLAPPSPVDFVVGPQPAVAPESPVISLNETRQTVEAVVANHTAEKLHPGLTRAYTVQAICTGLPLALVDMAVTATSLIVVSYLVNLSQGYGFNTGTWLQLPALLLFQLGLISLHQLYPGAGVSPVQELRGVVRSTVIAILCLSAMNLLLGQLPRIEFVSFACTATVIALLLPLARYLTRESLGKTSWWGIGTLLVGTPQDCVSIHEKMRSRRSAGFAIVGFVSGDANEIGSVDPSDLGHVDDAFSIACERNAPVAAIASPEMQETAHRLMFQFPSLVWISNAADDDNSSDVLGAFSRRLSMPFLRFIPRFCKRFLDLAIVIPGLIALTPLLAGLAIAIKLRSPGTVIYGSSRVGQHGKSFKMWKFRSMVMNSDEALQQKLATDAAALAEWERDSKLKDDPRIIPGVGHMLRRWSLDELPQLWNVLTGEMSLVGPRPVPPDEIVRYQSHYYEYTQMWPGMTGLWQVSGRNDTSFETRVFLVHSYAANWSLWLDAWILVKTPLTVLTRRGAY